MSLWLKTLERARARSTAPPTPTPPDARKSALAFVVLFPAFFAFYLAVEHPFMQNRWWKRLMPKH